MDYRFFSCVLVKPESSILKPMYWECSNESFKTMKEADEWAIRRSNYGANSAIQSRLLTKSAWVPNRLSAWLQLDHPSTTIFDIHIIPKEE